MSTKRKFRIGPVVRNFDELFQHDYFMIQLGSKCKTVHKAFVRSWQIDYCRRQIKQFRLRVAERLTNAEYYAGMTDDELFEMLETDVCECCEGKRTVVGACEGKWCDQALNAWKEEYVK